MHQNIQGARLQIEGQLFFQVKYKTVHVQFGQAKDTTPETMMDLCCWLARVCEANYRLQDSPWRSHGRRLRTLNLL